MILCFKILRLFESILNSPMDNLSRRPFLCNLFVLACMRPVAGTPLLPARSSLSLDTQAAARPQVPRRQLRLEACRPRGTWR